MTKTEMNRGNSAVTKAGPPIRLTFVSCVIQVHAEETFFILSVMFCTLVSSGNQAGEVGTHDGGRVQPHCAAHVLVLCPDTHYDTLLES